MCLQTLGTNASESHPSLVLVKWPSGLNHPVRANGSAVLGDRSGHTCPSVSSLYAKLNSTGRWMWLVHIWPKDDEFFHDIVRLRPNRIRKRPWLLYKRENV